MSTLHWGVWNCVGHIWKAGLAASFSFVGDVLLRLMGNALSFALRLRNRNKGASHTHIPKKVAISAKPGACDACLGYEVRAFCLAVCVSLAKWKNHKKWSTTTNTHEAKNLGEDSETNGQLGVKFWR